MVGSTMSTANNNDHDPLLIQTVLIKGLSYSIALAHHSLRLVRTEADRLAHP